MGEAQGEQGGIPAEGLKPFEPLRPSAESLLNRELSWLKFNERVLHQAVSEEHPLLERIRFLSIFSSNLDEFIMKRVGGLKRQWQAGLSAQSQDGMTPSAQLKAIRRALLPLLRRQDECFSGTLLPALAQAGVHLLTWEALNGEEKERAGRYFREAMFPVLTPLAVDPGHPFPFISNLSCSLGLVLRHPGKEETQFARVKVPEVLPRWVRVDGETAPEDWRFVSQEEVIRRHLDQLFPSMEILDVMPFRITRNADLERDEEDAEDLLEMVAEELRARRFARVVRLEHGAPPQPWILRLLKRELELGEDDLYERPALLDYRALDSIANLDLPQRRFKPWVPAVPPSLAGEEVDFFARIRAGDILVHHPYESFSGTVERFLLAAAEDPAVVAIKMTVYRTGDQSPFIPALIRAAQAGKQVATLVELKARFDEERNIYWAQQLEKAGVHVVYGIVGLKTHNKSALVVRREAGGLRCYAHIGTGNYNVQTARLYTDLGLFTCHREIVEDLVEVFHYLTGHSLQRRYRKLLVAPVNMRQAFMELIAGEASQARAGRPCGIIAKMNSLEDTRIIGALQAASIAGVPILLIVRGFCCLRPGLLGVSQRIRVLSVVGRFLEHSRIFYFRDGALDPLDGRFLIGSSDWMYRNLENRVEVVTPVESRPAKEKLWKILEIIQEDARQSWEMRPDGEYVLRTAGPGPSGASSQTALMEHTSRELRPNPKGPRPPPSPGP